MQNSHAKTISIAEKVTSLEINRVPDSYFNEIDSERINFLRESQNVHPLD